MSPASRCTPCQDRSQAHEAVLLSEALHRSLAGILADFPWTTLGLVCAATLATTCLAVVVSARAGALAGEQALGQVLRARD